MKLTLHYPTLLLISACLLLTTAEQTYSQWPADPNINVAICTSTNNQQYPTIVSDGSGGAIITWQDYRSGTNYDIYAQRINALGQVQWTTNGVAICTETGNQQYPTIVSDGSGGAIIAWQDYRNGISWSIYAQRINASGTVQWTANGVAICTAINGQYNPVSASDLSGGAIITWVDRRHSPYVEDLYAQRINASGTVQWIVNGVAICTETGDQRDPTIVSDGSGGAIIAWEDARVAGLNIYAQRINASGTNQWGFGGNAICTASDIQSGPKIISDGLQGAIITWNDRRSETNYDIYAQRINESGTVQWTANGVEISTAANSQVNPTIVNDGSGGAIITWQDGRGTNLNIYAQRINASGTIQWNVDGVAICTAVGHQQDPVSISDFSQGAIITWADDRSNGIYAQSINASGTVRWAANGVAVSTAPSVQTNPTIVSDFSGGAIITWHDQRNGNYDIYAQRVFSDGALPVELISFTAQTVSSGVELLWKTATEVNNYGFDVERSQKSEVRSQNLVWEKIGFVEGHGNSNSPKEYSFIDKTVLSGKYSYRLKQIDNDGQFEYSNIVEVDLGSPVEFSLAQNYPNPFNPSTVISFQLAVGSQVSLKVFDVLGREVETLLDEELEAGTYERKWNASHLPSGVYFYQLRAGSFVETKKLILLQ